MPHILAVSIVNKTSPGPRGGYMQDFGEGGGGGGGGGGKGPT